MRVDSYEEVNRLVAERGIRLVEHVQHTRGARVNAVRKDGTPITLRVVPPESPVVEKLADAAGVVIPDVTHKGAFNMTEILASTGWVKERSR